MNAPNRRRTTRTRLALTAALAAAGLTLGACNNAVEGGLSGAALGALGGMAIGSISGDMGKGAAIGAVVGGLGGAVLGDQNSRQARTSYFDGPSSSYRRDWNPDRHHGYGPRYSPRYHDGCDHR
jgi:surface antigen